MVSNKEESPRSPTWIITLIKLIHLNHPQKTFTNRQKALILLLTVFHSRGPQLNRITPRIHFYSHFLFSSIKLPLGQILKHVLCKAKRYNSYATVGVFRRDKGEPHFSIHKQLSLTIEETSKQELIPLIPKHHAHVENFLM